MVQVETHEGQVSPDDDRHDHQVINNMADNADLHHGEMISSVISDHLVPSVGDDDDDDDNWSRQVETDETNNIGFIHEDSFRMESVLEIQQPTMGDESTTLESIPQPLQPELTLKEKLVLRERQRRIETERARLKRQFALSGSSDADNYYDNDSDSAFNLTAERLHGGMIPEVATILSNCEGSIAEESTKAHPDHESMSQILEESGLGFNMERFLRNSEPFSSNMESVGVKEHIPSVQETGVLMERFLNEPIIVPPVVDVGVFHNELEVAAMDRPESTFPSELVGNIDHIRISSGGHRSVSFDVTSAPVQTFSSFGYEAANNTSIVSSTSAHGEPTELDYRHAVDVDTILSPSMDAQDFTSNASDGVAFDEPRFLRLTEADMEEMAAIEEASIGNAPPSDREEEMLSEIGELADFASSNALLLHDNTAASQDTQTTAMESASQISDGIGFHNQRMNRSNNLNPPSNSSIVDLNDNSTAWQQNSGRLPLSSSQLLLSPGMASDHSVIANPPSVVGVEEDEEMILHHMVIETERSMRLYSAVDADNRNSPNASRQIFDPLVVESEDTVDRLRRSGFVGSATCLETTTEVFKSLHSVSTKSDDDVPQESDALLMQERNVSEPNPTVGTAYGSIADAKLVEKPYVDVAGSEQSASLKAHFPTEVVSKWLKYRSTDHQRPRFQSLINCDRNSMRVSFHGGDVVESLFDEIRTYHEYEPVQDYHESLLYSQSGMIKRGKSSNFSVFLTRFDLTDLLSAFPERQFALFFTLLLEIPVFLLITENGDNLCRLVGRKKYNLFLGMLPLTSAIAGSVGLQASTMTMKAISSKHITKSTLFVWMKKEVGTAFCLGISMGLVLGGLALVASDWDISFAISMFLSQLVNIFTAGLTGTLAPLSFRFLFHRDSRSWGSPVETAVQDIVGSFVTMIISYNILLLSGTRQVDPSDVCGPVR